MVGTQTETIDWLRRQLGELEAWRADLIGQGRCEPRRLQQIDLHRDWLEDQISGLLKTQMAFGS